MSWDITMVYTLPHPAVIKFLEAIPDMIDMDIETHLKEHTLPEGGLLVVWPRGKYFGRNADEIEQIAHNVFLFVAGDD